MAVGVVLAVFAILSYLHSVSVLIISNGVIIGIVFDEVSVVVVFLLLPFTLHF